MSEEEQEVVEKKSINYELLVKIFSVIFAIGGLILLFFYVENILYLILSILGIVLIAAGIYFSFNLYRKYQELTEEKAEKLPEPVNEDELLKSIKEYLLWTQKNHIKNIAQTEYKTVGQGDQKTKVYIAKIKLLYPMLDKDRGDSERELKYYYAIKNAHYPKKHTTFVPADITDKKKRELIEKLAENPEDEPDIERKIWEDPMTKQRFQQERKIRKNKEIKKEKEDLK